MEKKTVVLGASENPSRYSFKAVQMLTQNHHPVIAVGLKEGKINNVDIHKDFPHVEEVDTITLYVGARNQPVYYNYILDLKPKRVIFNPGAENAELEVMLKEKGIEIVHGCTLVMLSIGSF